ncbi:malto-oligosyltrehalose synthase [Nocardioides lianchengensis]|uniref:(1->4)-alpha-D-glucan 1-alpha-D-glucosylmutase n=1 Tax=Nocardioides lianchengensis TaxID=1045774 RepID=A0A1G6ZSL9_9ACTN|nr:malto-oligosyltrehalose synthase [Nocardioides lianchengensis]NYG12207.1 (1->4)-alpha-D-glucan 1-alpha-D-glucosylmutase [Nocardioides lianchengensis]SDE05520.1 (1->4)-alpha-D-glucan 1-alpha-D-glucosylmutase [Nocardioides lianchengensis]
MRAPTSTYRLQITAELDLFKAADLLPYLHDLGADWVYLSPILEAEPGSTHGYDVIRHDRVDPARGGKEGLAALSAEARRLGMGVLVDIVPNHVGVATPSEDPWWWDVLKHGRDSAHAAAFDIDWDASHQKLQIPVVGDDDEAAIEVDLGAEEIRYHDNYFPLAPGTTTLEEQHYELVNWREADDGLNYRRFFAVNTLAAVRVEEPGVFEDTHVEIRRWFDEGLVDGLRVDHPDGLRDPGGYLRDLAELTGDAYVLVEKILEPGEQLLTSWATTGTTGYDALAHIDRVLTDPAGQAPLDALEARLRGGPVDWAEMIHDTKRAVADGILNSEVRRIVRDLRRHLPVVPAFRAEDAVAELLACFPVYRSYLPEGRAHLEEAFAEARRRRPDLTLTFGRIEPWMFDADLAASKRFQQTSGMVMAKGVEDCAFYRYSRLTSLNEVGGDPSVFALSVPDFHRELAERQRDWPLAMTTLSTHDTKRGEDVRARITALAELPAAWEAALESLLSLAPLPDPGFASLLWQAVLGAWPASRERLHGYAEKAMREAGDRTTWTEPDASYEDAVHAAVDAAFDSAAVRGVLDGLLEQVVAPGWSNALAAKLLALTMPGVPDVYQGSELWEQSLVDPDNRRPVDFEGRATLLASGSWSAPRPVLDDGASAKLHLTAIALRLRRDRPELFTSYDAVPAAGPAQDHVVAFDRGGALTVATRLPVGLTARGGWDDTALELPPGRWTDALGSWSGSGTAPLADVLADLPVALLVKES